MFSQHPDSLIQGVDLLHLPYLPQRLCSVPVGVAVWAKRNNGEVPLLLDVVTLRRRRGRANRAAKRSNGSKMLLLFLGLGLVVLAKHLRTMWLGTWGIPAEHRRTRKSSQSRGLYGTAASPPPRAGHPPLIAGQAVVAQ